MARTFRIEEEELLSIAHFPVKALFDKIGRAHV